MYMPTTQEVKDLRTQTKCGMMDCKKALVEAEGSFEDAKAILRKKGLASNQSREDKSTNEGAVKAKSSGKLGVLVALNCETDFVAKSGIFLETLDKICNYCLFCLSSEEEIETESLTTFEQNLGAIVQEKVKINRIETVKIAEGWLATYNHGISASSLIAFLGEEDRDVGRGLAMQLVANKPLAVTQKYFNAALLEKERKFVREEAESSGKPKEIVEKIVEGKIKKYLTENTLVMQPYLLDTEKTVEEVLDSKKLIITGSVYLSL